jgi:adenosylmethionine-8-amino-7-oxononanoate aminotransferase
LSGGYLPLAATLATEEVCAAFSGAVDSGRAFYHGHTYTGNALGCAAAIASLDLLRDQVLPQLAGKVERLRSLLAGQVLPLEHVGEVRHKGLMVGIELVQDPGSRAPYAAARRMGHQVTLQARRRGVIVRPLGDVVVLMPPLAISHDELELLVRTTAEAIQAATEPGEVPEGSSGASERECRLSRAPKAPEPSANGSRSTSRTLLVAGTDTGVGKTVVSVLLTTALGRRGLRTATMKPVESGCDAGGPQDAIALASATARELELADLCPYRLSLPVAPESAASAEEVEVQVPVIRAALDRLQRRAELVVVESAGGIGTPLAPDLLVLDLARELGLPVLLVARDVLGTVGQTLVALRTMAHEGVPCLGVLLSRTDDRPPGPEGPTHAPLLESHGGVPVLGLVPFISEPMPGSGPELRSWAARQAPRFESGVELDRILSRLEQISSL